MRKFEKISFEQFKKDISDDKELYDKYELPVRHSSKSAGYDIRSLTEGTIKPGEAMIFRTGLKVCMEDDEVLYLIGRSSLGYKYNVCLANNVGVIDADFYNNEANEGHFSVKLINHGKEDFKVEIGDRIVQGIFQKYLITDDDNCTEK
jgi:dUTP pyrophosphatase